MQYKQTNFKAIDDAYQPTKTSGIKARDDALRQYRLQSIKALQNYQSIEDIAYGDDEQQVLDLIFPISINQQTAIKKTRLKTALFVSIHGGYWQEQTHKDGSSMAEVFLQKGAIFASIHYRLCPKVSLRALVNDCKLALNHLIERHHQFGFDLNQIYLIGHSAGAHLAMALMADFKIAGALLISGIYDLTPIEFTQINQNIQLKKNEIKDLSYPNLPPKEQNLMRVMICFGQLESEEFQKQSKAILDHYRNHQQNCLFRAYQRLNHFDIVNQINQPNSAIRQDIENFWLKDL